MYREGARFRHDISNKVEDDGSRMQLSVRLRSFYMVRKGRKVFTWSTKETSKIAKNCMGQFSENLSFHP